MELQAPEDIVVEESIEPTKWTELSIICPHCGNHGEEDGPWEVNAWEPFKLIEEVVRSWIFSARLDDDGALFLVADTNSDSVDWESGANLRVECMQCFEQFPLPVGVPVDFQ